MEDGSGDEDGERFRRRGWRTKEGDAYAKKNAGHPAHLATHFFVSPTAIPVNRCLTEWISSVKPRLLPDKLLILNNLSVKPHLFTDKLSFLSQLFTVIGTWWRARQPHSAKN